MAVAPETLPPLSASLSTADIASAATPAQLIRQAADRATAFIDARIMAQSLPYQLFLYNIRAKMQRKVLVAAFPLSLSDPSDPMLSRTLDGNYTLGFFAPAGFAAEVLAWVPIEVARALEAAGLSVLETDITAVITTLSPDADINVEAHDPTVADRPEDIFIKTFIRNLGARIIDQLFEYFDPETGELKPDFKTLVQELDQATNGIGSRRRVEPSWRGMVLMWFGSVTANMYWNVNRAALLNCALHMLAIVEAKAASNLSKTAFSAEFQAFVDHPNFKNLVPIYLQRTTYKAYAMAPFEEDFKIMEGSIAAYHAMILPALAKIYALLGVTPPPPAYKNCEDFLRALSRQLRELFTRDAFFIASPEKAYEFNKTCFKLAMAYELIKEHPRNLTATNIAEGLGSFSAALLALGFKAEKIKEYMENLLFAILCKVRADRPLNLADFAALTDIVPRLDTLIHSINALPLLLVISPIQNHDFRRKYADVLPVYLPRTLGFKTEAQIEAFFRAIGHFRDFDFKGKLERASAEDGRPVVKVLLEEANVLDHGIIGGREKPAAIFFPPGTGFILKYGMTGRGEMAILGAELVAKKDYSPLLTRFLDESSLRPTEVQTYFGLSLIRDYFNRKTPDDPGKTEALIVEIVTKCLIDHENPEGLYKKLKDLGRVFPVPDTLTTLLLGREAAFLASVQECQALFKFWREVAGIEGERRASAGAAGGAIALPTPKDSEKEIMGVCVDLLTQIKESIQSHLALPRVAALNATIERNLGLLAQMQRYEAIDAAALRELPEFRRRSGSIISTGSGSEMESGRTPASRRGSTVVEGGTPARRSVSEGIAFARAGGGGEPATLRAISAPMTASPGLPPARASGTAATLVGAPEAVTTEPFSDGESEEGASPLGVGLLGQPSGDSGGVPGFLSPVSVGGLTSPPARPAEAKGEVVRRRVNAIEAAIKQRTEAGVPAPSGTAASPTPLAVAMGGIASAGGGMPAPAPALVPAPALEKDA